MKNKLKKTAATVMIVGTSFGVGGMVAAPQFANAAAGTEAAGETQRSPGQWIKNALASLVQDGTISQEQSDKVAASLESAQPRGGPGHRDGGGPRVAFPAAASAIGISEDELKEALRQDNATLGTVAQSKNVDVQKVVGAIVAAENKAIDEAQAAGRITADQANERKAKTTERVTRMVNEGRHQGGRGGPEGERPPMDPSEDVDRSQAESTSTTSA